MCEALEDLWRLLRGLVMLSMNGIMLMKLFLALMMSG